MKTQTNYFRIVQQQIKETRSLFEELLANSLNLIRVSAPLIVDHESGLNDRLTGVEKSIDFHVNSLNKDLEIVQSLAKWKRVAIAHYKMDYNEGLYTNMNALRKDENVDCTHSVYVDQWDWEVNIRRADRTMETLKKYVNHIYEALKITQQVITGRYEITANILPENIHFIDSRELENMYPTLSSNEREREITKLHKAVFITSIGWPLKNGSSHDTRSPDYDDWKLNGDLIVWDEVIDQALELSSMGIRVDAESLVLQLKHSDAMDRMQFNYHQDIYNNVLPLTIGGGIGQSRLCMFILAKQHIGEVQCSVWNEDVLNNPKYKIL